MHRVICLFCSQFALVLIAPIHRELHELDHSYMYDIKFLQHKEFYFIRVTSFETKLKVFQAK